MMRALATLGAVMALAGCVQPHVTHTPAYWSLVQIEPGVDPASGEYFDEYLLDYNLSYSDCQRERRLFDGIKVATICEFQQAGYFVPRL
jgi:hypothetical protein